MPTPGPNITIKYYGNESIWFENKISKCKIINEYDNGYHL